MNAQVFEWFQLEIDKQLETIKKLADAHSAETTDANYMIQLGSDLDRVIGTLEENDGQKETSTR